MLDVYEIGFYNVMGHIQILIFCVWRQRPDFDDC